MAMQFAVTGLEKSRRWCLCTEKYLDYEKVTASRSIIKMATDWIIVKKIYGFVQTRKTNGTVKNIVMENVDSRVFIEEVANTQRKLDSVARVSG